MNQKKYITRGFELLETRAFGERLNFNFGQSFTVPPIYKVYLETFILGRNKPLKNVYYLNPEYDKKSVLGRHECSIDSENLFIADLFSFEESLEIYNRIYKDNEDTDKRLFFPFGEDSSGHNLLVICLEGNDTEKVFLESPDESYKKGEKISLLADNVFEFIRSLVLVEMEEGVGFGIRYNQLYKNWEENFWRVRD
jgi:hypothetical protein